MSSGPRTLEVSGLDDIRGFFDGIACGYREAHGDAQRLLDRRLHLIRRLMGPQPGDVLLDLGCGPGVHLFPLAPAFRRVIGVDLSPRMIDVAARIAANQALDTRIELHAADAARLDCIERGSVDVVLCTGAIEHMRDHAAVLGEVARVLKSGGRFVCLTVNAAHYWYHSIAPLMGYAVRHLSSDCFLDAPALRSLLRQAQLEPSELGYWSFIARGDMPGWVAALMSVCDRAARVLPAARLRGGLYVSALKPPAGHVSQPLRAMRALA
jgi:2-polyprenyl-6-hydroxyphenyl methylase/3-demethylubiquinone-9 3-methyltransferase